MSAPPEFRVGNSSDEASAFIQFDSTTRATIPIPRMTTTQRNAIATPVKGDWVFDITLNAPFYHDGTAWRMVSYGTAADLSTLYQPLDSDLTALAALNSTGFARQAGAGAWAIVAETGTGSVVRATAPTIVTPTIVKIANLTSNGYVKTSGGDGTLSVVTGITVPQLASGIYGTTIGVATTTWTGIATSSQIQSTEANAQVIVPFACTVRKLYLKTTGAQPGAGSLVVTLRVNGADTALVVTVAAGAAAGVYSDLTNSGAIAAGDSLALRWVNNDGAAASAPIRAFSMQLDVTV